MVNQPEVPLVGILVSDLKNKENDLDTLHGKYINKICHDGNFINLSPKLVEGGKIKFALPDAVWAKANTWLFVQLQSFNSTMIATYELKVKEKKMPASVRDKHAIQCGEVCGFFRKGEVTTKAHVDAHISQWLPSLFQHSFLHHMASLFSLCAGTNYPLPPKDEELVSNYKMAKW